VHQANGPFGEIVLDVADAEYVLTKNPYAPSPGHAAADEELDVVNGHSGQCENFDGGYRYVGSAADTLHEDTVRGGRGFQLEFRGARGI
jgi:hypothetical protein